MLRHIDKTRHKRETFTMTPWGKEMQEMPLLKSEEIFRTYFGRYSTQIQPVQSMDQKNLEMSALGVSDEEDLLDVCALYKKSRLAGIFSFSINFTYLSYFNLREELN